MTAANVFDVILVGASTRAAAVSALRAGMTPWCIDLFADADLERIATVRRVPFDAYPEGLVAALADAPRVPVIYTGGLENYPDLIDRIDRPVWGNSGAVLRAVRSPERWTQCLREHGLPHPLIADKPEPTGRWLLKPRRSGGGLGIRDYAGQRFDPRTHFLQERIDGEPMSALFLGANDNASLIGITRQLIGTPWLHASGFQYAGNIGPLSLDYSNTFDHADTVRWREMGLALAASFHLRGLFGVDAIMRDGVPWPVEINPRYTAAVEVLERAWGQALLGWHRAVFADSVKPVDHVPLGLMCGKAILFARAPLRFPAGDFADCADLPYAGEFIEQDRPVLTLFASGETVSECERNLQEKAQTLDRALWD